MLVLLVDDHVLFRSGRRRLLSGLDETVVALSGEEGAALIRDVIQDGAAGCIPKSSTRRRG